MTDLPPAEVAAHVVVDDVEAPRLDEDSLHHLTRVRRLTVGTVCTVTDGAGRWRTCQLGSGPELEGVDEVVSVDAPSPRLTIAFALTKADKPEVVVQKLTELGIDRIVPFRADRSVVRWDERKARAQHARWSAIARGAVEQSRGVRLPVIERVGDLDAVIALGAARLDRGGSGPSLDHAAVAVGPEGGWSDRERERLPQVVGLGPTVLRAETAALTAGGLLTALRSGVVAVAPPASTERGNSQE